MFNSATFTILLHKIIPQSKLEVNFEWFPFAVKNFGDKKPWNVEVPYFLFSSRLPDFIHTNLAKWVNWKNKCYNFEV